MDTTGNQKSLSGSSQEAGLGASERTIRDKKSHEEEKILPRLRHTGMSSVVALLALCPSCSIPTPKANSQTLTPMPLFASPSQNIEHVYRLQTIQVINTNITTSYGTGYISAPAKPITTNQ